MFCTRCGNPVSEDDRFCRKCGAKVSAQTISPERNESVTRPEKRENGYRTPVRESEKIKLILPLTILTLIMFSFIVVLIVLINRPEPEPNPRSSNRISSIESASIEPETTSTTTTTTTTATTTVTETTTAPAKLSIQDLAEFSDGEIIADPAAVSEEGTSIVYHPVETDGDMYYCVDEWMDYLKNEAKLKFVGSSGSGILYTVYYDYKSEDIVKKKAKVDGESKKKEYVLSLVIVNDTETNAVLSVTANMAEGVEAADLLVRYTGENKPKVTTTTKLVSTSKNRKTTTVKTTSAASTKKTKNPRPSTSSTTARVTENSTYLQDIEDFSDKDITAVSERESGGVLVREYEAAVRSKDITDIVNMWINNIFDESDFEWQPTSVNYYTDEATWVLTNDGGRWKAEKYPHKFGRPMMEPMVWDATESKPFGQSRLKEPIRHLIEGYVRTVANATIGLEFATAPQKYLLGITDDQFDALKDTKFVQYVGSILLGTTNPETGEAPKYGQLPQGNIQPHTEMMRILATQFSAATGLTVADTGVVNDANPTSSDAILAQSQTLVLLAEQLNRGAGDALYNIGQMALAVELGTTPDKLPEEEKNIIAHFKNPAMPSIASSTDAAIKVASAREGFAQTDIFLEMIGFDQADIRRIRAQEQRVNGQKILMGEFVDDTERVDEVPGPDVTNLQEGS